MALDVGNFTLSLQRRTSDPTLLDLFHLPPPIPFAYASSSSSSTNTTATPLPYYTYQRAKLPTYRALLLDPITQSPLAEAQTAASSLLSRISNPAPSAPSIRPTDKELQRLAKSRSLRLFNPDAAVEMEKKRNTFSQEWVWKWEGETFVWHRDSGVGAAKATYTLEVSRKPEPDIAAAIYKPKSRPFASSPGLDVGVGPLSTTAPQNFLQIFSYNLQRLDISDRRGLEVALVMSLMALLDLEYDERQKGTGNVYGVQREWLEEDVGGLPSSNSTTTPIYQGSTPSHPIPIRSSSTPQRQPERNEIYVDLYGSENTFISHALMLLRSDEGGDGCPFIILRAQGRETIQKAVRVAAECKREWYRLPAKAKGPPLDENDTSGELHQYVQSQEVGAGGRGETQGSRPSTATTTAGAAGADQERPAVRQRIKLNEPAKNESTTSTALDPVTSSPSASTAPYIPPQSLTIWLSKLRLPELESKAQQTKAGKGRNAAPTTPTPTPPAAAGAAQGSRPGMGRPSNSNSNSKANATYAPPPHIPPKTPHVPSSASGSGSASFAPHSNSGSNGGPSSSPPTSTSKVSRIGEGVGKLLGRLGGSGGSGHRDREGSSGGN